MYKNSDFGQKSVKRFFDPNFCQKLKILTKNPIFYEPSNFFKNPHIGHKCDFLSKKSKFWSKSERFLKIYYTLKILMLK